MSPFAQYIQEREGKSIIEDEFGFATYFYVENHCYIEDVFVLKEHRKGHHASRYAAIIAAEAKLKGYNKLLGSVAVKAHNSTYSTMALITNGFKIISCEPNTIYFEKMID